MDEYRNKPVTEDRVRIMINDSIEKYHKENIERFDRLIARVDSITELINKAKGVLFTLVIIGGLPAFIYYIIQIVKILR